MPNFNQVVLVGNLTRNPELRYTAAGSAIGSFSLAVSNRKSETSFFDVVTFGPTAANVAKYVEKGRCVLVSGYLRQRTWEHDGGTRSAVEIVANTVEFL